MHLHTILPVMSVIIIRAQLYSEYVCTVHKSCERHWSITIYGICTRSLIFDACM